MHLICDNLATHKTTAINDWFDKHPRFHRHFTPTCSSSINQVERCSVCSPTNSCGAAFTKALPHSKDVRDWITAWNDNPKPFRWTKTAYEILDSLATYSTDFRRNTLVS